MAKADRLALNENLNEKSDNFIQRLNSDMHYKSELTSDSMTYDWVDEIEFACPYIDNIVRNPKVALVKEEDVVKVEKAKKTSVASIKDLSRHTHYIEKFDEKTMEVQPAKILIERSEETYNTYENRFMYTLIDNLYRFVAKRKMDLENMEIKSDKLLEYAGTTVAGGERINIEVKVSANELPNGKEEDEDGFNREKEEMLARINHIYEFIGSWRVSEMIQSLDKAHVSFVTPPIKKTNIILKNPNFQVANKIWTYLQTYDEDDMDNSKEGIDTSGDGNLKGLLDDAFLMNYFVLDSVSSSRKNQKEKLTNYAIVMIHQQIQRIISILMNSGIDITDEEIMELIAKEIKHEKNRRVVNSSDVKNKFKSAFEEYLEKTQNYL